MHNILLALQHSFNTNLEAVFQLQISSLLQHQRVQINSTDQCILAKASAADPTAAVLVYDDQQAVKLCKHPTSAAWPKQHQLQPALQHAMQPSTVFLCQTNTLRNVCFRDQHCLMTRTAPSALHTPAHSHRWRKDNAASGSL
jgi:hypothetical protein